MPVLTKLVSHGSWQNQVIISLISFNMQSEDLCGRKTKDRKGKVFYKGSWRRGAFQGGLLTEQECLSTKTVEVCLPYKLVGVLVG